MESKKQKLAESQFFVRIKSDMRTGIATIPLDYGRCPRWLFERMKRLARGIIITLVEEFGPDEVLKRLSDPIWFQSFGCVLGFDWNSSGLTTTTLGAVKAALFDIQDKLGIFICGGKGKTSRKTPEQIQKFGEFLSFSPKQVERMVYTSKISAKVDSSCIQNLYNPFQIYHHNFIFTKSGQWAVVQQGMATEIQKARRYHWLSTNVKDFVEEPHSGIVADERTNPLNLVAKESKGNKEISTELTKEEPKTFLRDIELISGRQNHLIRQRRLPGFTEVELNNVEFYSHSVLREKFDLKRLKKIINKAHFLKPKNFEGLLATEGVGPKTIRALSLVSELIYGAKPSYQDPARYSFAHGGKDATPYPVDRDIYDKTIEILEKGIQKSQISDKEKDKAKYRLVKRFR